jgi:hypothetical protein
MEGKSSRVSVGGFAVSKDFWGWNAYGERLKECPYCGWEAKKCECLKELEK